VPITLSVVEIVALVAAILAVAIGLGFVLRRKRLPGPTDLAIEAPAEGTPSMEVATPPARENWFTRGLARSRDALGLGRFFGGAKVDEAMLQSLEDTLVAVDVGVKTASAIVSALKKAAPTAGEAGLRSMLRGELLKRIGPARPIATVSGPLVILIVGVNGSGKTTTIGKLAGRYQRAGKKVLLAAGDTFRAGAIEQLKVWGERSGVPVVAHQEGSDPAAVIYDALQAATARKCDVVICDTAGRLQAQKTLMDELAKVVRVMKKAIPEAPHEVLLVLDATIGQNAISQARIFKEVVGVTGVVLTKLDGTARGGVVVAVNQETGLPVKLVGLGEGIDDLRDFEPEAFVDGLLGEAPGR
jgi:fused signal recognition particle receptor